MISAATVKKRPKYRLVYDQLVAHLKDRKYQVGDRLPSEREFAAELNVNVLTVRRAFRDLIAADFVTKRVGSGTYLNRTPSSDWSQHAVNLLIDSSCHSAVQRLFEQSGRKISEKHQREFRIVHTNSGTDVRSLIHSYILYRQPTIFCGTLPHYKGFYEDVAKAPELFVAAAVHEDHSVPAVIAADAVGIDMLMDHLLTLGHRKIAFLSSQSYDSEFPDSVISLQHAAWRSKIGADYDDSLVIKVDLTKSDNHIDGVYNAVKSLKKIDFTALLCLTDEFMFGAMAALRERGKSIPGDVSIVSIGNTVLSSYAYPPVTSCDLDLEGHLDEAFQLLVHNLTHPGNLEMLRLIKPFLVARDSVKNMN